ncbi:sonic hedgehog protein-like [Diadema antillarum]|uniref:sonic hedgehog protein-like n=1 Tax=Diadema antillarum TaxID=105358 RepID=UPI003A85F0D8
MSHSVILRVAVVLMCLVTVSESCNPGRSGKTSHRPQNRTPLQYKQRVPNIAENMVGASGPAEGPIARGDERFHSLSPNPNGDIVFKDEEGTGADRLMTQRCKDKLNTLAISVMNKWPGIKLRVVEAWDEDQPNRKSLHAEGRAVDITTSDRDKEKYGALARLAVDAGFDWVFYETKSWVHCSVKTEAAAATKSDGCFPGLSQAYLSNGRTIRMLDIRVGDEVAVVDDNGGLTFSDVVMIVHRKLNDSTLFYVIETDDGRVVQLTPQHLIYVSDTASGFANSQAVFASEVRTSQFVYTTVQNHDRGEVRPRRVVSITKRWGLSAVAPVTRRGSLIVDNVAVSSYAVIRDEWLAHASFAPYRWYSSVKHVLGVADTDTGQAKTVHWYTQGLYKLGKYFASDRLYPGVEV